VINQGRTETSLPLLGCACKRHWM